MKTTLSALALSFLAAASAFAGTDAFTGKYSVDAGHCDGVLRQGERAYVSIQRHEGVKSLLIQSYGEDASAVEVLLGVGSRQAPGTSVEFHGAVTQSWQANLRGRVLQSVVNTARPSIGFKMTAVTTLTLDGDALDIETVQTIGEKEKTTFCRLIRD